MFRFCRSSFVALMFAGLLAASGVPAAPPLPYVYKSPGIALGVPGAQSGSAIARDGVWLAIGMPGYDVNDATASGTVAIYRWRDGRWSSQPWLNLFRLGAGVTEQANARFGASVALVGDRLLVGCPGCESPRPKVYLIELTDPLTYPPTWYPLYPALISAHDPQFGIGAAVAMDGDTVAVGAPNARSTAGGVERGAVALGRFDGGTVVWDEIVFGPTSPAGSRFGQALAMTNSAGTIFTSVRSLLVGAPAYASGFGLAGRAYLYERPGFMGAWNLAQEFANESPSGIADALGWSVAIARPNVDETGYIALGAPGRSVAATPGGGVRLYSRTSPGSQYVFENEIQHADAAIGDRFGISIGLAVDGTATRVLVGADGRHVDSAPDQGAVYVFQRLSNGPPWLLRQTLEFVGSGNAAFGRALAVSPSTVVIGLPDSVEQAGLVSVYVCDRILADGMEGTSAEVCALP